MSAAQRKERLADPAPAAATPFGEAAPDKLWHGELRRDGLAVTGHLADPWGWRLAVVGRLIDQADELDRTNRVTRYTRLDITLQPDNAQPHEVWRGHMTRGDADWTGYAERGDGWMIHLAAQPSRAGALDLSGFVAHTPGRHRP